MAAKEETPATRGYVPGRGPLALRCGNKPHRRAECGRSDPVLDFVRSRQRFVYRCHGQKKAPAIDGYKMPSSITVFWTTDVVFGQPMWAGPVKAVLRSARS